MSRVLGPAIAFERFGAPFERLAASGRPLLIGLNRRLGRSSSTKVGRRALRARPPVQAANEGPSR
eukprot:5177359-Alexandrium_andersonii.AAC.1